MAMPIDGKAIKGRGAAEQVPNRFLKQHYAMVHPEGVDEVEEGSSATRYLIEESRSIINPVNSPDLPFKWSLNPYQGCEHGCSYCYARATHEYWGYSAGLDFERVVIIKRNAPALLEQALRHRNWQGEPITMSGATDPYQPVERREGLPRRLLEVMDAFNQPVSLITKNALVLRDLDLLASMASRRLAAVAISLTTLDESLRRVLEPRTSSGVNRLRAIRTLADAGVPVHVMVAPLIPTLNEPELPALLKAAAEAGAGSAGYTVLRTNGAVEPIFRHWLQQHFPDRAAKVIAQTKALHGGHMGDATAGRRMKGEGVFSQNIQRLFRVMHRRYFGDRQFQPLDSSQFKPPPQGQLDLFS
jgi:DNA repair photolyase